MRIPALPTLSLCPFKGEFRAYGLRSLRQDLLAALAVALLSIPQSIAYSLLAGLPPIAGLLSAIFGTIFSSSLGSSRVLVSGPSTGVAILIQTSIANLLSTYFDQVQGPERDALVMHILGQIVLIVGIIQVGAAFFNVSKLLQFVSRPVILGYFAGIVIATIINQLYYFLGISLSGGENFVLYKALQLVKNIHTINWHTCGIGIASLFLLMILKRKPNKMKWLPDALIVLIFASALNYLLSFVVEQEDVKTLRVFALSTESFIHFRFSLLDFTLINKVFPAAVAIAFLAIIEVSAIARNFAVRTNQQAQANQDALGLGVANTFLAFLTGAMPVSGSATRTALNFTLHAQTRISAILCGAFTALFVLFCLPLLQLIPLAALATLMIVAAPAFIDRKEFMLVIRATREDRWVFLFTCSFCLIFDLDVAFFTGVVLSIAIYLRRSSIPHLVEYAFNAKGRLMVVGPQEHAQRKVRIIGIGGDLYFGSADVFQAALQEVAADPDVQAIVLRLNNVYHMDASICLAIQQLEKQLVAQNRYLVISGLTEEVWHVFHRTGLVKQIGLDNLYFTDESNPQFSTWKACLRAQDLVHTPSADREPPLDRGVDN